MRRDPATGAPDLFAVARDWLHAYLPTVRGLSGNTIAAYRISLECFLGYLADTEHVDRDQVGFEHLDRARLKAWLAWMRTVQHYAPRTVTLRLTAIRAFLAYAAAEDIAIVTLHQQARTLHVPASPRAPIRYLDHDQTRALLAAHTGVTAKSRRNRMLLILLYETAARVSEITGLRLHEVSLAAPGHVTVTGKGSKTRTVPISSATIEHLGVYLEEFHPGRARLPGDRPLFYSYHRGQPSELSTDTVTAVLKTAAETARVDCPSMPERIHCHLLRKTKAMDLYQQGIPLPIIMRLLGHENTSTTAAFYAFATLDMMREAINAATPAITTSPGAPLTQQALKALHDLR